jgi:transcriptional regulator with XRE-family HTH domain
VPQKKTASKTTADDSNEFDVGQRLRRIRLARQLTLSKVAKAAGISEGFLSQIERGVGNASIATLRSVAGVLGVEMRDLFDESSDRVHAVL